MAMSVAAQRPVKPAGPAAPTFPSWGKPFITGGPVWIQHQNGALPKDGRFCFFIRPTRFQTRAEHHGGPRDGRVTPTRGDRSPHIPSLLSALTTP
eukprot:1655121-Prymnesium_polylepis.1